MGEEVEEALDAEHGADEHAEAGAHGEGEEHGEEHGPPPPLFLVIPFAALLLMIATGPLFYPHHWHHHYPKYAVALGLIVSVYYLLILSTAVPILHAAQEYISFIALLASLFVASGCILIKTDFAGTPRANSLLLLIGAVISNVIGTTGASMLLIRPYMRLNAGRIKAYHIIFFIFVVSNVGGALTPIGDPPLFLGFLRGVPFFWTVAHIWYIWIPTVLVLIGIFYLVDSRNKLESNRTVLEASGIDVDPGEGEGSVAPVAATHTTSHIAIEGKRGFLWLAIVIGAVFIDPNVITALAGTPLDFVGTYHLPFGIREIIMLGVCFAAYKTAEPHVLRGNEFNFEPIREVAWLFVGIFLTMQPALELIRLFAQENAEALGVTTFYFGTGMLSGVLDNAPTYVSFLSAAMGKFGLDVNQSTQVLAFASDPSAATGFYLQAISVAAVFFGALTYIGNGPNFMVKAIAESAGVQTPSFVAYVVKYA
ncbi:MAG: citrate transporter, partial [Rhodothermaceae bacterium]|nr:citrate transporter [Rhodothermaceae bacterium]